MPQLSSTYFYPSPPASSDKRSFTAEMAELQIPSHEVIEALCTVSAHSANHLDYSDRIWIKYGIYVTLAEAAMQQYVNSHADPRIVRVPSVFDAFTINRPNGAAVTHIVMENVGGGDFAACCKWDSQVAEQVMERIANAVRHIWDLPLPPNAAIGPLGHQAPVDRFFSDVGSGRSFNNVVELQDWINTKLDEARRPDRVILQGERLSICHCDLTPFNIRMSEPIAIIDWGFAGIYPRAFEEFALLHQGLTFAKALNRQLFGPKPSKHIHVMATPFLRSFNSRKHLIFVPAECKDKFQDILDPHSRTFP